LPWHTEDIMLTINQDIINIFNDAEDQINHQKSVFEEMYFSDSNYSSMVALYVDHDQPYAIAVPPPTSSLEETIPRLAEILHLYPAMNCHAAYVTLQSTYELEDKEYGALNIFFMSHSNAFNMTLPYKEENNYIVWYDNLSTTIQVDDQDLDSTGKDIVSIFYTFVNSNEISFTKEDVLSYLSYTGATIHFMNDNHVNYLHFENQQ